MKIVPFLLVLAVSGCAGTAAGIRDNAPFYAAKTDKKGQQVVECVAPKWANIYGTPSVVPSPEGASIIVGTDLGPELILDAKDDGSVVFYKANKLWGSKDDRMREAVQACL